MAKPAVVVSEVVAKPAEGASEAGAAKPDLFKKKELLDQVAQKSGIKRRDVKLVLETALAVLGETIESGTSLNLPPMGKLRVVKTMDKPNGKITVCKLRRPNKAAE